MPRRPRTASRLPAGAPRLVSVKTGVSTISGRFLRVLRSVKWTIRTTAAGGLAAVGVPGAMKVDGRRIERSRRHVATFVECIG